MWRLDKERDIGRSSYMETQQFYPVVALALSPGTLSLRF